MHLGGLVLWLQFGTSDADMHVYNSLTLHGMRVCVCVSLCVCVYGCAYMCMGVCMCVSACVCVHVYGYVWVWMCSSVCSSLTFCILVPVECIRYNRYNIYLHACL